jgi:hypothetical protein
MQPIRLFALLTSTFAAACARDAPEAIAAQRFDAPAVVAGATSIQVGRTDLGEGRARIAVSGPTLYQGAVGYRAYLSVDNGATFTLRRPAGRYSNEQNLLLLDQLTAGADYRVKLVSVSNLGFESATSVTTWDADNDTNTPPVPIALAIPATNVDATLPLVPYAPSAEWHGDAVSLRWSAGSDRDLYGYQVERGDAAAGPFAALGALVLDSENPHYRDDTAQSGQTYHYRLLAEDLSGNRSAASTATAFTVR